MPSLRKLEEIKFSVIDVVAVSCAVYRTNGFVKRHDIEVHGKEKKSNSNILYSHFFNNKKVEVIASDYADSNVLIEYLRGLSFKAFERTLTDFESNVLKFVTSESVGKDQLGIAASLPSVYNRKLEADKWTAREAVLANTSEYVGNVGSRCDFTLTIENVRYIAKTDSSLYSCSEGFNNIVKFFSTISIGQAGNTITVSGFVKNHSVSNYSNGKETMINRVKIIPPKV